MTNKTQPSIDEQIQAVLDEKGTILTVGSLQVTAVTAEVFDALCTLMEQYANEVIGDDLKGYADINDPNIVSWTNGYNDRGAEQRAKLTTTKEAKHD